MSVPAKTQYELAHELAQRNASLPIEQGGLGFPLDNTAMDRAKAMGFDTEVPLYHATKGNFGEFNTGKGKYSGDAIWTTPHKEFQPVAHSLGRSVGDMHNYVEGANVMPLLTKIEHPLLLDNEGMVNWAQNSFADGSNNFPQLIRPDTVAGLRDAGYDGIKFKGTELKGWGKYADENIVFNPNQIRSRFAAFDPMQRNSANILAGGAGAAVGLNSLSNLLYRDEYQ
jgi:hypothetical protein